MIAPDAHYKSSGCTSLLVRARACRRAVFLRAFSLLHTVLASALLAIAEMLAATNVLAPSLMIIVCKGGLHFACLERGSAKVSSKCRQTSLRRFLYGFLM